MYYLLHKLFLSKRIIELMDELARKFNEAHFIYETNERFKKDPLNSHDWLSNNKLAAFNITRVDIPKILEQIENEFAIVLEMKY